MKIYNIIIEPEALEDLLNIKSFITKSDTINRANIFIKELKSKIETLKTMPRRCRKSLYTKEEDTFDLIDFLQNSSPRANPPVGLSLYDEFCKKSNI